MVDFLKITLGKWNKVGSERGKVIKEGAVISEPEWWRIVILLRETKELGEEIAFGGNDEFDF